MKTTDKAIYTTDPELAERVLSGREYKTDTGVRRRQSEYRQRIKEQEKQDYKVRKNDDVLMYLLVGKEYKIIQEENQIRIVIKSKLTSGA